VEQIKARLGWGPGGSEVLPGALAKFQDFKDKSQHFQRGDILPIVFHAHIARLGLQPIVPEAGQRPLPRPPGSPQQLLEAHLSSPGNGRGPAGLRLWAP